MVGNHTGLRRMGQGALLLLAGVGAGSLLGVNRSAAIAAPPAQAPGAAMSRQVQLLSRRTDVLQGIVRDLRDKVSGQKAQIAQFEETVAGQDRKIAALETANREVVSSLRKEIEARLTQASSRSVTRDAVDTQLRAALGPIAKKLEKVSVQEIDGQYSLVVEGANLHVRNGQGGTATANGLGNVIVGYHEVGSAAGGREARAGSHNVVVGSEHTYSGWGGLVAGTRNSLGAPFTTVAGGRENRAEAPHSVILGGERGSTKGESSSVIGGQNGKTLVKGAVGIGE